MPKYVLNGKTYNIPDSLTQKFESENPNATIGYTAGGKHYNIPVSKRDKFLKAFPDATTGEQKKPETQAQMPTQQPTQAEAQPTEQPQQQAPTPLQMPQGFGQLDIQQANQMGAGRGPVSWEQPEPKQETVVDKTARMMQGKATPQEQKQVQSRMQQRKDEIAYKEETGKDLRQPVLNTEFEAPTVSRDENGNILIGNTTDQDRVSTHQQVAQEQKEFEEERALMQKLGLGGDIPEFDFKSADLQLEEALREREELEEELEYAKAHGGVKTAMRADPMMGITPEQSREDNPDVYNIESAIRLLDRRIAAIKGETEDAGFIRGTTDVLTSTSALSFGASDLADAAIMSSLKERIDAVGGDVSKLSASERTLVRNILLEQKAQRYNANRNGRYNIGQQFGNTLNFMKDFYLTGGGFASVAKQGLRMGTKAGLKFINSGVAKAVARNLGVSGKVLNKSIQYGLKYGGLAAGAEAGGALLAGTVQMPKTAANIINRHTGNLNIDSDKKLSFEGGEELGKAALYEFLKASGENASELVGPMFDFMPKILGRTIANTTTGRILKGLTDNKYWRKGEKILDYGGIQGLWGEGMEEEAGMMRTQFLNYITGGEYDPNAESITDIDTHLDTWYTTLVTGALLRAPQAVAAGYSQVQHYGDMYNLNRSDKNMRGVLGDERYQNIKTALDEATNKTFGKTLGNIMKNGGLSNEEKEAVMFYANDLVKLRGDNIGELIAKASGVQAPPKVVSYNKRGNGFDEVDAQGNVLNHYEFETNDEMKAALYESQQKRFDEGLNEDISAMKTRPGDEYSRMLAEYSAQVGVEQAELEAALAKPSMERTEAEQAMVLPFAKLLHDTVYDNTMVHEEQSAQDGANLADEMGIDLNNLSPAQVEQAQQITADFSAAQQALNQAFAADENLQQEVERLEKVEKMPKQGIVSTLGELGFRPNQVQAVIDYYNAEAKFNGFKLQMANNINEAAANERQRHTLKGTIDGKADLNNVHTISDGTNEYYLVSGDITTDPATGRITGSGSGLIIGMDLDGSFVNISDTDGYSVMPVTQTLDQWEEAERTRLQEQITQVIDPNQTMNPAAQQQTQQPQEQIVAEAGANTGTGANEATVAPSSETQQPTTPAQPQQPVQIPIDERTKVKMYEQGVPVDQAINDMQADGFDPNLMATAHINKAQKQLDKINKKIQDGDFEPVDLMERKRLTGVIDYYNNVKARFAELNTPAESEEIVNNQPKQPTITEKPVSSQSNSLTVEEQKQQRIAEAKAKYGELFDDDFTKANDVYELVSMWLGRGRGLDPDSFGQELGWNIGVGKDAAKVSTMFTRRRKNGGNGMLFNDVVHTIWESSENEVEGEKRFDTEEIRNALIDLFHSATSKSDVVDYALNTREAQARAALAEEQQRAEEETQNPTEELVDLTEEQVANMEANLPFPMPSAEGNIVELLDAIDELSSEEGTPELKLIDTDFMSDEDWYDLTSRLREGAFVSLEEVDETRRSVLSDGLYIIEDTGAVTIYSDSQTAEEVKQKVEYIKNNYNGRSNEEETGGLEAQDLQRPAEGAVAEAQRQDATNVHSGSIQGSELDREDGSRGQGAGGTGLSDSRGRAETDGLQSRGNQGTGESQDRGTEGSQEQEVEDYLQPRNAEEEQIIADVHEQLQSEIAAAIKERDKAASDLQKAQTKESDRATDMFSDDEAFQQPDQLFSFDEMGGTDRTQEGVNRRTEAERKRLQDAQKKVDQLQSPQERNSRIRGALDNYRKQTSFADTEKQIDERHKQEYDQYIKPLLGRSDEELQQMAKSKEDAVGGDLKQLEGDLEYSAIQNVLLQREYDRQHNDAKIFIANTIDDDDVTFVDKLTVTEFDKLQRLIDEYGVDDAEGKIEAYVKQLRKKYPVESAKQTKQNQPKWQYNFHYNKETGRAWITRDDVSGPIPLQDGRFYIEGKSLAELRAILENPKNNLGELLKEVEAQLHNAEVGEQMRRESDPMEAIAQSAQSFREEQAEKNYGADNKLVTTERYEELKKRMIQKLGGQLNSGFDPEILAIGTEMAVYHIEAGARKFTDFAQRMIAELGDAIRPYLKAIYNGARDMPGMEELRKQMTSYEGVSLMDVQNIPNASDNTVNEHKEENNEAENVVSLQQETEETVERKAEDADKYRAFSQAVANDMLAAMESGEKPYKSIKDIRAKAKEVGLEVDDEGRTDILLQELVEDGLVSAARQYVNTYVIQQMLSGNNAAEVRQSRDLFNDIVKLYNLQPTISQRSSNRIKMGQYSTPLPMSFVADVFAYKEGMKDVLEPTAGNGMMVFAIPEFTIHANELDDTRLDNLRAQKFKEVTDQDATQPFEGRDYDAIVANPPFGGAVAKEYDGKMIPGLAEQIALNALSKMKDNGRAAIIIGGNMEYAPNGAINSDKAFFTYLYDHYNVKGVIDMDGKLFSKQGTTYPTRLILIDGRRSEEERAQVKVYPPVLKDSPMKVKTFEELFDIAEEIRKDNRKTNGNEVLRTSESGGLLDHSNTPRNTNGERRSGQPNENVSHAVQPERRVAGRRNSDRDTSRDLFGGLEETPRSNVEPVRGLGDSGVSEQSPATVGREASPNNGSTTERGGETSDRERSAANNVGETQRNEPARPDNVGERRSDERIEEKRELSSDKLPYRPHNTAFSLESVAPAAMVEAMDNTLKAIEKQYGNIDSFVTKELGYDSIKDMHNALAAEQVDSVAMAIWNMKNGEGMIIGDQTGVGKGRQMAALIRWAVKQGKKPIFVTKDADLFSDIYRDLVDIGSGELRPFIFNSGVTITDANGVVVHKSLSDAAQKKVLAMNELPEGFDFTILSYPQMNTGDAISQEESGKAAKDRGEWGSKKGKAVKAGRPTPKADFLRRIAKDNYLLMDESQNAAGSGNTGAYFQSILKDAKAVTFASATFAKRPDTMPLYAIRTAISKAKVKTWELLQMIGKGGVTLQEIMSRAMTQAGQMVRRERDMSDVKTDWKTITDKATAEKARRNYDNVMRAFNAIIDFQDNYIKPALAAKSMEFASMASTVSSRRGTEKAGVDNPPFVNRLYNFSKQLLLSLKVDAVVDEVVAEIEAGRHPVIALENTLESALDEYGVGDVIEDPTLFGKLKKGLDATFRYTLKNEDGDEMGGELQPHELGAEGEQAYYNLVDLIQESTQGMFISPLDAITEKLEEKGYSVGEISGRKTRAVLNSDGKYEVRKRENTDRKKLARDFNSGAVDVLIINKTGSTGISLHASNRFSDQRQRTMIMAQPLSDINDYMQMIGRIDRTGQVHRGYYINLGLPVPAETRFMMMLANKLKSLNANTTTSQENKDNDVDAPDLLNKYGDQVMIEYLRDNPDVYRKLGEFLKDKSERGAEGVSAARLDEYQPKEGDAKQITGRVALLSVDEQDAFYDDVTRRYNELIKYLNDTGSNDLKISVLPLNARTIDREVSSEGTAPNSGNPFADNAYVEWVDMDILKKPMKASDVGKTIEQLNPEVEAPKIEAKTAAQEKALNGKLTPRIRQIISIVEKETQEKLDKENERYEAAKKRAEEDIEAKAETINKQQKRTPEQKKEAIDKYATERRQAVEESHQNMVNKIDASHDRLMRYLKMFEVGDSVLVPDDLTTDAFLGSSNGIFCGFKTKDEGITPSTTLAVFATLDGRRKIEVKLSDWGALTRINNMTEQNWDAAYEITLSNWDEKIPSSSRKKGFIMTGNILQAISDTNFQGRLVTFTDDKGNVRDGVLMPDKWEPSQLKGSTVPISARKERITTMPMKESVTSSDGRVTITRYWGYYTLDVPKSKKQGGEFYLDKTLLDLVEGNDFFTKSGNMRGRVDNSNINAVIDRLGEMSVTLPSDKKVEFKNPEESDARITDPMQAIEEASHAFHQERGFYQRTKEELDEITQRVMDIPKRFGLNAAITQVINSRSELEQLKGKVSDNVYKMIEQGYNKPGVTGVHISGVGIVVVFGEKVKDAEDAELTWWHEQTHNFWHSLPADVREKYGRTLLNYLRQYYPEQYDIVTSYWPDKWNNEACSFFVEAVINQYGMDKFMNASFAGNEIICNFANGLRDYLRNGTRQQTQGSTSNQLRRNGSEQLEVESHRRRHLRGRNEQLAGDRQEAEEVDYRISNPLEAIRRAADDWRRERAERESDIKDLSDYSAKQVYHDRIDRVETMFAESWQDDMVTFKAGQDAIAKDKDIPDSQNAYMAANLAHGKIYNQQENFTNFFKKPLLEAINKILKQMNWRMGDVDRYVFTKHGFERNREFFVRDFFNKEWKKTIRSVEELNADEQELFFEKEARLHEQFDDGIIETEEQLNKKLAKALQDSHEEYLSELQQWYERIKQERYVDLMEGKINFQEYLNELDTFIQRNIDEGYDPNEHDYSGFTQMFGDEEGKYDEAEILADLMAVEEEMGEENMKELWNRINLISAYGLDNYRRAGMSNEDTITRISNMFHWYVPMRGFGESQAADDHWQYMTRNDGQAAHLGGLLKHAKGRKSEANYPIATLLGMTLKAIGDCEQNMVKQKLWRLCQANPNDLIVTSDAWVVLEPVSGEWVTAYPEIDSDMTGPMVDAKVKEFNERMRELELEGQAKRIRGKEHFDYKVDSKKRSEHVIEVKLNGERKLMVVTGNPRMAQAINGQLRYEGGKSIFAKVNTAMKQFMQSMSTSFNITFVGRNMMRDLTHFTAILNVREGAGYTAAAEKYYMTQLPKMKSLFKKYRENTLDETKEIERDFKDFMDNGGITGFVHMQKVEQYQKEMEKLFKAKNAGKPIKVNNKVWEYTLGAIEAMNEAIENNARFATYRASRHYAGRTRARSAYDAKEVTVNFNKKGAGRKTAGFKSENKNVERAAKVFGATGQVLAANKMFFNATIQAICTIFKNFQNKDGSINWPYVGKFVSLYAAPQFVMGLAMPLVNQILYSLGGGGDDDPYANLPEWTRRKNLCIYMGWVPGAGKNDFLILPLGQELAAFYSLGDMGAGLTYSPNIRPVDRGLDDEVLGFFSVFSPVDFDTKVTDNEKFAPVSEYVGRVSSVAAPLVAIGENTSWMGRPIFRGDKYPNDEWVPEYQMAFNSTNKQFVDFSKFLNDISGGNDVERGVIQINPGTLQYLVEQYTGGPGKLFANTLVSAGKDAKEFVTTGEAPDFNIRKIEGVRAFYQQSDDRNQYYRAQAKYRKYKEDAEKLYDAVKGYEGGAAENPEYLLKLEQISKGEDFVRMQIVREADKTLSQINKAANKAEGKERKELRKLYNEQVSEIVRLLDEVGQE